MRVILPVVLVAVGTSAGVAYALTRDSSSGAANGQTSTTVTASTGTVQQTVTTAGTLEPKQDEDLSFDVGGTVTSVRVSVGQKVTKGAVLATIDDTTLQSSLDTAEAAVSAAEEELDAVSGESDAQVAAAEAQLASSKTDLANAQEDLAAASLTAPFTGIVAEVTMAVGDVAGGSSPAGTGSNPEASSSSSSIRLISTTAWVVSSSVGSSDLAQLKKGMQAQITPSGTSQKIFGTVSALGIVAESSSGSSATFPVTITVTGSPTGLYAGGSADVSLVVKQLTNVLTVPTAAISTDNGETVVYRMVDGKRTRTVITVGDALGGSTVVKSGLKNGDKVQLTFTRPTQRRTGGGNNQNNQLPGGDFPQGGFPGGGDFPAGGFGGVGQ